VDENDALSWYSFDDRGIYRPGETARVKGWLRRIEPGRDGDIRGLGKEGGRIQWTLNAPRGGELQRGEAKLSALGGFDLAVALPGDIDLGTAWLAIEMENAGGLGNPQHTHPIRIAEFRRPEFEVALRVEPGPYVLGEERSATVKASYYAGGGLPDAPVVWTARMSPGLTSGTGRSAISVSVSQCFPATVTVRVHGSCALLATIALYFAS